MLRDTGEFDFDVFGPVQRCAKVEVGDVKGAELGTFVPGGENTVDHVFDQFEWCCFGANITGVTDAVASNGDACLIWVSILWADFADNVAVADFFEMIGRYVGTVNYMEGVRAVHWWSSVPLKPWQSWPSSLA